MSGAAPDKAQRVDLLSPDDAAGGLALSTQAGWNQTLEDWTYLLTAGQGFGIRIGGELVATSLALPYPPVFGWVSMVLVEPEHRRQGMATRLLHRAVDHLSGLGLASVLDATPEGRPVYVNLGFVDTEIIDRWQGLGSGNGAPGASRTDFSEWAALDLAAFGADRRLLLAAIGARPDSSVYTVDGGYGILRVGRVAQHLGPVVSLTTEGGRRVIHEVLAEAHGAILVDVPRSARALADDLRAAGFTVQRSFYRMVLGSALGAGTGAAIMVTAGPELG